MAFGDLFGTKLIYQRNDDGSSSFSEIPGVVSSAFGNPMTYERIEPEVTSNPNQYSAPAGPAAPTGGATSPYTGGGGIDYNAQLQNLQKQAGVIQAGIDNLGSGEPTLGAIFNTPDLYTPPATPDRTLTPDEESDILRRQMRLFQTEIDATNEIYDQMLRERQMEGEGRLGSQRAIAARGGLLGSDFAGAQKDRVLSYNADIEGGVQAERTAKIGEIMGLARQAAADEIALKNQYRSQEADDYLTDLANKQNVQAANVSRVVQAMIDQGIGPDELMGGELDTIATDLGISSENLKAAYSQIKSQADASAAEAELETRKTEAEIAKIEADIESGKIKTIGEGTMLYNTETGEYFKNPKTYKPDNPTGYQLGDMTLNEGQIADIHQTLNETRPDLQYDENGSVRAPEDSYADTGVYLEQLNFWTALGGNPNDFIKEFDPDLYINPNDPSRTFLQQFMRRTPNEDALSDAEELQQTVETLQILSGGV